jgi:sensor domain CHASE-containing protein
MQLRSKVIALLLTLFAAYAGIEYAIQRWVVYPGFLALEREEASKNVERAVQALQRDLDLLVPSATDWAVWDDTYQFVQDRNEDFVASNLNFQALKALAVNVVAIYDSAGGLLWSGAYDLNAEKALELPKLVRPQLSADHFLMQKSSGEEPVVGIFQTEAGSMLVAAHAVLTSAGEGPPMGSVLMGRLLDAEAVARLGTQARVDLRMVAPHTTQRPLVATQEPGRIAQTTAELVETSAFTVGHTTVMDIHGNPALTLMVTTARDISVRGRDALRFASLSLLVAGSLVLLLLVVVLRRTVLDPVSRLTAHVTVLGASDDLTARIDSDRQDEIGVLSREFDHMVQRLAETRQRLLEQSYNSGVAEMASGVLHNIGNAITPVGVKLGSLKAALRQAPVEDIDLAAAELADPAIDPGRRDDMHRFFELAGKELSAVVRRTSRDLEEILAQVDHVQLILADQQRFSRADRVVEAVVVARLVHETVELLPETARARMDVELDPGVHEVSPVRASRVALQQVVSNLLINAAEAIGDHGGREPAQVRVSAEEEVLEGIPMVRLRFADPGAGISAETLPHIFERGFSTKSRGSGMGLHWSANTVLALGGRMYAESDGAGRGACLHVLLPQAVEANASLENAA